MSDYELQQVFSYLEEEGLYPDVEQLLSPNVCHYVRVSLFMTEGSPVCQLEALSGSLTDVDLTEVQYEKIKEMLNGKTCSESVSD